MQTYASPFAAHRATGVPEVRQRANERHADYRNRQKETATLKFSRGAQYASFQPPHVAEPFERDRIAKRGKVTRFSFKSQARLQDRLSQVRTDAKALFVTLTYPGDWPGDWQTWKRHLHNFDKWLKRRCKDRSYLWKLEFQTRGAPHYHLLLWGVDFLPHEDLAAAWYRIVGSGDERHLRAGVSIEAVRSHRGVMAYASKLYMGKDAFTEDCAGRYWGVRGHLPLGEMTEILLPFEYAVKANRTFRRWFASKGIRRRGRWMRRIYGDLDIVRQVMIFWIDEAEREALRRCQPF